MECIYFGDNCNCCEGIENPIYPCKWEEDNYMNIVENSCKHKKRVKHKRYYLSRGYMRYRDKVYKKHLKFLADNITGYPSPVVYTDKIWVKGKGWVDNPKPYYKRCYRGRGRHSNSNYHKKMSNRKIRRYTGELPRKGNLSHKLYDFWWELY